MRLDLGVYGVLLAAGLGAAYWASQPVSETEDDKVTVAALDPKSVVEVSYRGDGQATTATRRDDGRYWVAYEKKGAPAPPAAAPDPHAALDPLKQPPPPAPTPDVQERFLGNDKMTEVLAGFNPLQAARVIGKVDDGQLADFGLKDRKESVTVKSDGGKSMTFVLGKKSYGSRNRFVQEEGSGRVLLVEDGAFENLEKANLRMYDRRVLPFEMDEVTHVAIAAAGKTKRLTHTQRDKNGELQWADDEEGAASKPSYQSWMDKVGKLRLAGYATPDEEKALAQLPPFLTVAFEKSGKALDSLTFKKQPGTPDVYWVRSEFLKTEAKLAPNRAEPIEKDIAQILGAPAGGS